MVVVVALVVACWAPPVDAPVVDPFRPPPCAWCPGNRGIEYGPTPGQPVRAVAAGTVSFAGTVAGTRYVVVDHGDGLRATYGRLAAASLGVGERVAAGQVIGTTTAEAYFGLRRGDLAVDPTPLLGTWRRRPRLVPLDGTPARPAPAPRLVCGGGGTGR